MIGLDNSNFEKINRYITFFLEGVIINFMLVFLSIMGFLIFGWAPAVVAVLTVIKKRVVYKEESRGYVALIKEIWKIYLKEFKHSNTLGSLVFILILILSFNLKMLKNINQWIYILTLSIRFMVGIVSFVIFPVYVYYEMKIKECITKSILFMALNPMMIVSLLIWSWLNSKVIEIFPKISFLIGGYIFLLGLMLINYQFFKKNSDKQKGNGGL